MIRVLVESISDIDSAYYKYLLEYPPKGVLFLNKNKKLLITSSRKFLSRLKIKRLFHKILKYSNLPKIKKARKHFNVDLYHSSHTFLITDKPYVIDFEHYWILSYSSESAYGVIGKKLIKKLFLRKNLKYILPWTYAAYNSIPKEIRSDKKIRDKIKVVYPAVPTNKYPRKKYNKLKIIFTSRYFMLKGEHIIYKIYKILHMKYQDCVELIIVAPVPSNVSQKYNFIKFYDIMPQEDLFKLFEKAHIYIYPRYIDTFGFTILEAMSFGMPVIASDGFARRELITDNETGFIIPRSKNEIEHYIDKISELIENPSLLKSMSRRAFKEIKYGKFSIRRRNKVLKEVYESAIE